MKPNIVIFSLEPLESRYTCEWFTHLPEMFKDKLGSEFNIIQVNGVQKNSIVTEGAFLNFSDTNYWKSSQLCNFLELLNNGTITTNDHILLTDFWNPAVIQLKYMKELLQYNWKIHGLAHAGSYDSGDFLGRAAGNSEWATHAEKSFKDCFDHLYFATNFHLNIFKKNLYNNVGNFSNCCISGWPMEYMMRDYSFSISEKEDIILFPHRIAPEKQIEIFKDLEKTLPNYKFIVCQEQNLTKEEYHTLLKKSKMVFSANLQETLGISTCAEGPLFGALPLAPNRLSYTEIFAEYPMFMYDTIYTESYYHYQANKSKLVSKIKDMMENYQTYISSVRSYNQNYLPFYFSADNILKNIVN